MKKEEGMNVLSDEFTRIVVETDEENPVTIATIENDIVIASAGYRIRMTPTYD